MKNYKDTTITKLCQMLNYLDDNGCLTDEDRHEYGEIMLDYAANYKTEETLDDILSLDYTSHRNCYILKSREDGEVIVKTYEDDKDNVMMRDVSKHICFSDCDDTWEVIKIVYQGREVEYNGWQPGMVMSYDYAGTDDEAWSGVFEQWDH